MSDKTDKKKPKVVFEIEDDAAELMREALESARAVREDEDEAEDAASRPKKKEQGATKGSIDLHGLTLDEAIQRVDQAISRYTSRQHGRVELTIITGKGLHSGAGGAVLPRGVHHHVKTRYARMIESIESSPADTLVGGVPLRGHFSVVFKW